MSDKSLLGSFCATTFSLLKSLIWNRNSVNLSETRVIDSSNSRSSVSVAGSLLVRNCRSQYCTLVRLLRLRALIQWSKAKSFNLLTSRQPRASSVTRGTNLPASPFSSDNVFSTPSSVARRCFNRLKSNTFFL